PPLRGARRPAGVRADLRTDATALRLPIEYTSHDRPGRIDVLLNGELHTRVDLPVGTTTVHVPLPEGEHDLQVVLTFRERYVDRGGAYRQVDPGVQFAVEQHIDAPGTVMGGVLDRQPQGRGVGAQVRADSGRPPGAPERG